MTAYMLGEVLNEAGVPPGVVNLVFGLGSKAGNSLVSHPKVPLISFTGGTKTGEMIAKVTFNNFKKVLVNSKYLYVTRLVHPFARSSLLNWEAKTPTLFLMMLTLRNV